MNEINESIFNHSEFDENSKIYLLETAKWGKFLGIIGIISTGLLLVGGLFSAVFFSSTMSSALSETQRMPAFGGIAMLMIYILVALIYIYPIYSLMKFSNCLKSGLTTNNQSLISEGFRYQKNLYKFIGVFTIIIIAFYLLAFIFGGLGAMFMGS